jgi:cysteine desulfurase family protein
MMAFGGGEEGNMIYLDNAATTMRKPQEVIDAVMLAMGSMGNAGRGVNDASLSASRLIYDTRERLCRMFGGTDPRQVVFTCNSTESLNIAIRGLLNPGDHVITTMLEHNSVLRPLYDLEAKGTSLTIIESDRSGNFDIEDMKRAVRPETKMIVCTNGSNLTGNYVELKPIGEFARERGILFVVDASQTAGVFPINVEEMKIDVLCFTGHKGLLGPQGTGGMYVREGVNIRPLKAGGTGVQTYSKSQPVQMPTALEAGTLNGHGIAGLHAALGYIEEHGIGAIRKREQELMRRFYEGVKDIENVTVYGDFDTMDRCAIVTLNIGDYDSSEVSDELLTGYGISTRSGGHCAPLMHKALGTVEQGAVRFSFSHYNTDEEVDAAVKAVRELAADEE